VNKQTLRPYLIRLAIIFALSVVIVIAFNEGSYFLLKDQNDRAPKTIQMIIPEGAAASVEAGQNPIDLTEDMVFVVGDVLEVTNQDSLSHQLGPIWVPPGTTGRLVMENIGKFAYSCSFSTTQYLGLDIRQPTTLGTRLLALSFAAPTMTALIFIYSLAAFPIKAPEEKTGGDP
jgi:hypothetical protein